VKEKLLESFSSFVEDLEQDEETFLKLNLSNYESFENRICEDTLNDKVEN